MAGGTLKLCGEPVVPGLALPKAFESLEKQLECVGSLCKLKGSHEAQTAGLLLVCGELQRMLRLAFIENGILASRIEILTRYQDDFVKKCEKRLRGFETEQKITRRYLKKLRQRQYKYEAVRKAKDREWWKVEVSCSDYDSINTLSRISGNPNLDFMLRINQLFLDFVKDANSNELSLPPMGSEERAELSKLASLYKLRCRFNKSTQVASSTIIKARQTCLPASGEIDTLLNSFTKKQKDGEIVDSETAGSPKDGEKDLSTDNTTLSAIGPVSDSSQKDVTKDENSIPSYMLTPVSAIGTPTITLEGGDPNTTTTPIDLNFRRNQFSQGDGLSESPLPLGLHAGLRPGPSVRVTKIDTGGGGPHTLLQFLPDSLGSSSSHPNKPQVLLPSSLPTYSNLLPSTSSSLSSASTNALQMALLMQSQQLRALSAAAAAVTGGQSTSPSSSSFTPPSSGRSTVLATPLSLSLPTTSTSTRTTSGGMKRESTISGTGGKRSKVTRRSTGID